MNRSTDYYRGTSCSSELLGVPSPPVGSGRGSLASGLVALLAEASVLLTGRGQAAELSLVLLLRDDPVDPGVVLDGVVGGVDEDDLEEFVGGVLAHPVGVEHAHVGASSANLLLSHGPVASGLLDLADTLVDGLSVDDTLVDGSLPAAASDLNSVDSIALLGLEAEGAGLVHAGGTVDLVDGGQLSVLPGPDSEHESHDVALLLSPQLLEVLVSSHLIY